MFVSSTVAAFSCVVVALYYGHKLAASLLTVAPVIAVVIYATKQFNEFMKKKEDFYYTPAQEIVQETLTNIRSVSAYCGESHEREKYMKRLNFVHDCEITRGTINGIVGAVMWAVMYGMYGFAFRFGGDLLKTDRRYTVASLIVVRFA